MQVSITHTCVRTFIRISMQMSKRRQHRHISALPFPLSLCLYQPLWRICGECSGFCLCRNCHCCCCCCFIFGSGILRAFVEQKARGGCATVQKGAFYIPRQTDREREREEANVRTMVLNKL